MNRAWPVALVALCALAPAVAVRAAEGGNKPQSPHAQSQQPLQKRPLQEEAQRVTDETAYTLEDGRLRLGVWKIQYGLFDFATVGTYTLPWSVLAATVHGKLRVVQVGPVALAVQAGFAYFDSTRLRWLDDPVGDATVTVVPVEAFASFRLGEALSLSTSAGYTEVAVDGSLSLDAVGGAARGVADNFQLTATAVLRLSGALALIVHGRWLVLQRVAGNAEAILYPDAFTTVKVNGDASASDFSVRDAYSVVPSVLMSLGAFNLRLGVGYGNYNVPLVNFVLPQRTLIPELDLYLLF